MKGFNSRPVVKSIDVDEYLRKLGVYKELPSLNYLKKIHKNHLLSIPFENLDIHFRKEIVLDVRKILAKILRSKRGGFCYELNLSFYHLLVHLGYDCYLISCKVWSEDSQEYGHEYDHMAILLKIQNDILLCDVGFGDGFNYPKKISTSELQMDYNRYFRLTKDVDDVYYLTRSSDGSSFKKLYCFELKKREPIEFIDRCSYHQTSPQSRFVGHKIMTKLTAIGRISLTDKEMKIEEKGEMLAVPILNEDAFYAKMEEHFGISYQSLLQN